MNRMYGILITARPMHWVKNVIIFAPLLFSHAVFESSLVINAFITFFLFCLLSSSIYFINDIMDYEKDRLHPKKSKRPIAADILSKRDAAVASIVLFLLSITISYLLSTMVAGIIIIYFIVNLLYSSILKHIVILDAMIIASGFVLRVIAGSVAINAVISSWLIICTTLLSLFLAFGKRRHELILMQEEAKNHRAILDEYNPYFLDQMISVVTASTVVTYSLYTMSADVINKLGTQYLNLTIPFVLYGVFRYLYLIHQKEMGGSPTRTLLTDVPLLVNIVLWFITAFIILYN